MCQQRWRSAGEESLGKMISCAAGIRAEAALDGIYVVRTNLPADAIGAEEAVEAYKNLSRVERGFRHMKTDLRVRPIHVRTGEQRGVTISELSEYIASNAVQKYGFVQAAELVTKPAS